MIKNYRMVIDLIVNISEQITTELIAKAKENCSFETDFYPRQLYLDMLQYLITYIIQHPDLHNECIYGGLIFKMLSYNSDEELDETTDIEPDTFENNMLIAAEALGPEYVTFINQVYHYQSDDDEDSDATPTSGDNIIALAEARIPKKEMPAEEREILIELLHLCLVDITIINTSLKPAAEETLPIDGDPEE
ncbi:MAG: hypothetical protein NT166_00295 [Candidatus Aminicenantes bacterium]|nr:hypothetical protein [Candidatus Aminicenantes bacterium]